MTDNLQPNSKDCIYGGYKLSSVVPRIVCSDNVVQINIGCENDDEFYSCFNLDGRVQILIETEHDIISVDLEQVLEFAKEYCAGIFERVNSKQ